MKQEQHGPGVLYYPRDYKDRRYPGPYHVRRDTPRKGWFIWGVSSDEYLIMGGVHRVVAMPQGQTRGPRMGWRTRADALAVCAAMNGGSDSGFSCNPFREHGLWQCRGFDAFGRHFNRAFRTTREKDAFLSAMRRGDNRVPRY